MMVWLEEHPIVLIVGGIAIFFLVIPQVLKLGQQATGTSSQLAGTSNNTNADLSGLTTSAGGTPIAYVPTQTIFSTTNITKGSTVNSPNSVNAPSATTVTSQAPSSVNVTTPVSITNPVTLVPSPVPVAKPPTPSAPPRNGTPTPVSNPKTGHLQWDQNYSIKHGDTLSAIAAHLTQRLRSAGMPTSMSVTYNDIYAHNMAVINAASAKHGTPIKGYATPAQLNNIFPGEVITLPRWVKG